MPIQLPVCPTKPDEKDRYKPEIGDILWGEKYDFLAKPELIGDRKILPLVVVDQNPFRALTWLDVDFKEADFTYQCPYTEQTFHGVVPFALAARDFSRYKKQRLAHSQYVFDVDYHKENCGDYSPWDFWFESRILQLFLGSGYTEFCRSFDGSVEMRNAVVPLGDDLIMVKFWEWYNK